MQTVAVQELVEASGLKARPQPGPAVAATPSMSPALANEVKASGSLEGAIARLANYESYDLLREALRVQARMVA